MVFPFDYENQLIEKPHTDTVKSRDLFINGFVSDLHREGARDISVEDNRILFQAMRGFRYPLYGPFVRMTKGIVTVAGDNGQLRVSYHLEYKGSVISSALYLLGLSIVLIGFSLASILPFIAIIWITANCIMLLGSIGVFHLLLKHRLRQTRQG